MKSDKKGFIGTTFTLAGSTITLAAVLLFLGKQALGSLIVFISTKLFGWLWKPFRKKNEEKNE